MVSVYVFGRPVSALFYYINFRRRSAEEEILSDLEDEQWTIATVAKSKLFVIMAKHQDRLGHYQEALDFCNKAEFINPEKAGVKGLKKSLNEKLLLEVSDV